MCSSDLESGVPGFDYSTWYAVFGPAAMPRPIITKLNGEIARMLADKDLASRLAVQGAEPSPGTPEQLGRYMREEQDRWRSVIKSANLKLD